MTLKPCYRELNPALKAWLYFNWNKTLDFNTEMEAELITTLLVPIVKT